MTKTKPFLSTCYGDPSATEVPPCFEAATRKLTFSTTSVLLLLDVPLSLSRGTIFRRQKNPRRGYRPKIAGILFVCNQPGRSIPYCAQSSLTRSANDRRHLIRPTPFPVSVTLPRVWATCCRYLLCFAITQCW